MNHPTTRRLPDPGRAQSGQMNGMEDMSGVKSRAPEKLLIVQKWADAAYLPVCAWTAVTLPALAVNPFDMGAHCCPR